MNVVNEVTKHTIENKRTTKRTIRIDSFHELSNYLKKRKLCIEISSESDIAWKTLKFMDGISKLSKKIEKRKLTFIFVLILVNLALHVHNFVKFCLYSISLKLEEEKLLI